MARPFTLTQRVVWAVTGTVAVLVGLQTALAYFAMHEQEDRLTDELLEREVQQLKTRLAQPGTMPTGALLSSSRVKAWLTRPGNDSAELPASVAALPPGEYQLAPDGRTWHVAIADTDDGRLSVVLDATVSEARVHGFGVTLIAIWALCVAVTAFIARGVAAIAVGPIVAATRSIARWVPDREPDARRADEAALLMEAFNRFRDRADETVAREREFAANLDHEIRTPLTSIRTDAELIALETALAPPQQQRVERIMAAVDEIIATTASTLSTSAGRAVEAEAVDLRDIVRTACDAMADRAASSRLRIGIEVAPGQSLVIDRQALLTVCRNIVRNAVEHAAPATLTVTGDQHRLAFRDDGPGIAAAALPHIFERYHQGRRVDTEGSAGFGADGPRRGLGLAIARRLCDLHGWRLTVRSPADNGRGTAFELEFAQPA